MLLPPTVQPNVLVGLSNTSSPIVRGVSRLMAIGPVKPAVVKSAVLFAPSATMPLCQLPAWPQLYVPAMLVIQVPLWAIAFAGIKPEINRATVPKYVLRRGTTRRLPGPSGPSARGETTAGCRDVR